MARQVDIRSLFLGLENHHPLRWFFPDWPGNGRISDEPRPPRDKKASFVDLNLGKGAKCPQICGLPFCLPQIVRGILDAGGEIPNLLNVESWKS
jgi:hypothetical protein